MTPDADFPTAPAGEQNAPGETVGAWFEVALGVGVGVKFEGFPTCIETFSESIFVSPTKV